MDPSDAQLIDQYAQGSSDALARLIRRHVDLVYAAAVRLTRDPGLADDVTQSVFILLSKKAGSLRSHVTIAGWLIVTTRQVARAAVRGRQRRHWHERHGAKSEIAQMNSDASAFNELSRVLDDALAKLRAADRDAIVLRYLQALSLADVGRSLGVTEEAARKRVSRGVQQLKQLFARDGVSIDSVSLAIFAAAPAPQAVVDAAVALKPSAKAISLSKGTMRMLAIQRAVVLSLIMVLVGAAAITVVAQANKAAPATPPAQVVQAPASAEAKINIKTLALQLSVSDVEENLAFFDKIGFTMVWNDKRNAAGQLLGASVRCGNVSIRLIRVDHPLHYSKDACAYFYVDAGPAVLRLLRNHITARNVDAGAIGFAGQLRQFDVVTPDGFTLGFYSQP
jgi:RNA polymerase sigma factor (sigma-70 family)